MNQNPTWKYLLLGAVVLVCVLYALPNVFGQDPAIQISKPSAAVGQSAVKQTRQTLNKNHLPYKNANLKNGNVQVRFGNTQTQLKAAGVLKKALGSDYVVALNLEPRTPGWLRAIGGRPMALGLDLRGGIHFLLQVDIQTALKRTRQRYAADLPRILRQKNLRYAGARVEDKNILVQFRSEKTRDDALDTLQSNFPDLAFKKTQNGDNPAIAATLSQDKKQHIREFAIKQNLTTIRKRVNELGVSEPIVQRQGQDRIVVELPGVQNAAQAKNILGATSTLEFHLVDQNANAQRAAKTGDIPSGDELQHTKSGRPVLLKRDVIATGNQLVDATSGFAKDSGSPAVFVTLNGTAASKMYHTTQRNIGRPMAVLYIQNKVNTTYNKQGKRVTHRHREEKVISIATIQGVFGKRFQTTGLSQKEATNLALLLRAGALAAPVEIIQQRTIGPSLGQDNIHRGEMAVLIGFLAVVVFMAAYYGVFGLFADIALLLDLIMIVAILSLLQATLTLPGIAGIVLTLGMSVDANVLIYERIREEVDAGNSPQASINAGYDKAFSSVFDAHITTLIAAIVLFIAGTGPVKGFAITLSIGILTSLFTAIFVSRVAANLVYGGRKVPKLSV
jgi:preprotein translocase subunit SecD